MQDRLVKFPANVIVGVDILNKNYATEHLTKQLIRSETSAALNYGEAQAAESRRDFIHKMKVCLKELRESQVNLQILECAELVRNQKEFETIAQECKELVAIFTTSIKTPKSKMQKNEYHSSPFTFKILYLKFRI